MDKGIYCLVFHNPAGTVRIGALGENTFRKGWHVYVGSALGSGGLKRVDRHMALAQERDRRPKWHVDYLLTQDNFPLRYAIIAVTSLRLECLVASALGGDSIPGVRLQRLYLRVAPFFRDLDPRDEIRNVFRSLQLAPVTKTLKNP